MELMFWIVGIGALAVLADVLRTQLRGGVIR